MVPFHVQVSYTILLLLLLLLLVVGFGGLFFLLFSSSTQSPYLNFRHCHRRLPHNDFTNTSVLFFLVLCKFRNLCLSAITLIKNPNLI